ncbi:HlyC/CorC family transporter [Sinimarinibacterium sp. CAU 1509]|uniref:hemolysin family protein n=1 Tax=Sinimarinibacterium sp. CAU 1509 TaxID=2562283 RepID=UPI0010AC2F9C|nr:hemolysin family protein [Sinimarinibacterium sp. CAU 1509]TJY58204.1 HlyC/CorC family transporter [Sinimarinibacterium sp. CAU 1509]
MLLNLAIVILLILLNGMLAMSELAVVSSRRARLQAMKRRGVHGASAALQLKQQLGSLLSTIQIGITLIGVLAGAFSGATLASPLAQALSASGVLQNYADEIALAVVVSTITYLSLIVGELVPKQIALRNPERIASAIAPLMRRLMRLSSPLVRLMDLSSTALLKLLPSHTGPTTRVTDEEIHAIVAEAASTGVVEPEERMMIAAVMRLADRSVRAVMTPRQYLDWIDLDEPVEQQRATLRASQHSRLIAARGDIDQFVGIVSTKRLLDAQLDGGTAVLPAAHVEDALVLPESVAALGAIAKLKQSPIHAAIVVDEFGSLQGLVTVTDILSAIAGEFDLDEPPPMMQRRSDGSWWVDGELSAGELAERLQLDLPDRNAYETVAGLVLQLLGHLPERGETVDLPPWRFEVLELEGRRIDKLGIRRLDATTSR